MGHKARNAMARALRRAAQLQIEAAGEAVDARWDMDDEPAWATLAQERSADLYRRARNERAAALGLELEDAPPKAPPRRSPFWDLLPKTEGFWP
jgi:hypothetical protein